VVNENEKEIYYIN